MRAFSPQARLVFLSEDPLGPGIGIGSPQILFFEAYYTDVAAIVGFQATT